ncbi:MAG TPA: FAD-binding protein, partial [Saprospiraceae bacterium]|nr:FAD-binding protein [Saprospiraceae bacterium]
MIKTDVLVVGGGVAGLSFAIWMAEKRKDLEITVLTKADVTESNT